MMLMIVMIKLKDVALAASATTAASTTTLMSFWNWLSASLNQPTRELIRLKIHNTTTTAKTRVTYSYSHLACVVR